MEDSNVAAAPTGASPTSTPPSGTATSGTQTGATPSAPEPWRAPPSSGRWAGMTAEQVLAHTVQLENEHGQMYGLLQQLTPKAPPAPSAPTLADDDFATGAQVRGYLDQRAAQFQQSFGQSAEQAASVARGLVEQQDPEPFKRWGGEIDLLLKNVPKQNWTLDAVRQAVRIVKADHVDELAAEKAERLAAERIPTMRSNGGAGTGSGPSTTFAGLDDAAIPDHWKRSAAAVGLSERELQEFCALNNMTPDQFVAQFKQGNILTAVSETRVDPRSVRRTI